MNLKKPFKNLCGSLFKSRLKWICSGVVPPQHCKMDECRYMRESDPYSIFQLEAQNSSYLLFFRYRRMSECRTLELLDLHNVLCLNHLNQSENLFFGFSHRLCFDQPMQLTRELWDNCGAKGFEDDLLSGYYYANLQTNQSVDFFKARNCGCGLLGSPTLCALCLLLSLVLVLCLRWRRH